MYARKITTSLEGRSLVSVWTRPMRSTEPMPVAMRPKIVCLPVCVHHTGGGGISLQHRKRERERERHCGFTVEVRCRGQCDEKL